MQLNKASRFGLYATVMMAAEPEARVSASAVARALRISENHVAKVLQQLARSRLITSTRGVGGGYQLARDPAELTMLEIVEAIDGPLLDPCVGCDLRHPDDTGCTPHFAACSIRNVLDELNQQAYYTLKSVTVATLARQGLRQVGVEAGPGR